MLYIPIRLFVAFVCTATLAIDGTVVSGADNQPQPGVPKPGIVTTAPQQNTVTVQSGRVSQQNITLGAGERLQSVLEKTVRQMDPGLTSGQVVSAVHALIADLQAEAPGADLNNLKPGVSMLIMRRQATTGDIMWEVYLGKYSGIEREEG